MRIKSVDNVGFLTTYTEEVDIFGIYWKDGKDRIFGNKTYLYGLPKHCYGLIAYDLRKVEVIDDNLSGKFVYHYNNKMPGIFHWALIKEALLDDLLERDRKAYGRFLEIIKSEGLVAEDFE